VRAEFERFIKKFMFDSITIRKLIRKLHSRFADKLPFPAFTKANQKLSNMVGKDLAITREYDDIMQKFMLAVTPNPSSVFSTPQDDSNPPSRSSQSEHRSEPRSKDPPSSESA
jgi:hypothetical protein